MIGEFNKALVLLTGFERYRFLFLWGRWFGLDPPSISKALLFNLDFAEGDSDFLESHPTELVTFLLLITSLKFRLGRFFGEEIFRFGISIRRSFISFS